MTRALGLVLPMLAACGGQLPVSTSVQELPPAEATVAAHGEAILVDGARVDGSRRDGQRYVEVHEALLERAMALRSGGGAFRGTLALELHPQLPSEVLLDLVYTSAQAGFDAQWLVVEGPSGDRRGLPLRTPRITVTEAGRSAPTEEAGSWANPRLALDPGRGFVLQVHDRVVDPGGGITLACEKIPCEQWPLVELSRLARRVKLDHPRDRTAMVAPAPEVPVQTLVHALDAVRDDALLASGTREVFPVVHLTASLESP